MTILNEVSQTLHFLTRESFQIETHMGQSDPVMTRPPSGSLMGSSLRLLLSRHHSFDRVKRFS